MFVDHEPVGAANFLEARAERRLHRQTYILGGLFAVGVALLSGLGAYASYQSVRHGTTVLAQVGAAPVLANLRRLVFGASARVDTRREARERTNILLLGVGGEGHEGSQLTDTIILASLEVKQKRVSLLSIPRDLAYPLGAGRFEKINAIQAYAEQEYPGEGARRTADTLARLLEIDIDHVIRVDFQGFAQFVDAMGGIDLEIEHAFSDPQYPTLDGRWTTVMFKQGFQHLSGAEALILARSRHGNNGEGSDFARSRRQQLIMLAMRDKLSSPRTLSDASKLSALYSVVSSHVQTDLTLWDFLQMAPLMQEFSRERVTTRVLTDAPEGELTAGTVAGAFMLFPKKPDWSEIRELAQKPFAEPGAGIKNSVSSPQSAGLGAKKDVTVELVVIEIKNGTARTGFAAQVAARLEQAGYEIVAFGNALRRGYERTVIYDLTNGKKPSQLAGLRRLLQADVSIIPITPDPADPKRPKIIFNDGLAPERLAAPNVDFLVILGEASYAILATPYASSSSTRP